jgi:hypothetical protein
MRVVVELVLIVLCRFEHGTPGKWPVAPTLVERFVQDRGIASVAAASRWAHRGSVVTTDTGLIQQTDDYAHRYSCSQRHPGVCVTRDAAVYADVLSLASNIERALPVDCTHRFFRLSHPASEEPLVLYFAHHRRRRPHAQQTHIFARCTVSEDDDGRHQCLDTVTNPQCHTHLLFVRHRRPIAVHHILCACMHTGLLAHVMIIALPLNRRRPYHANMHTRGAMYFDLYHGVSVFHWQLYM